MHPDSPNTWVGYADTSHGITAPRNFAQYEFRIPQSCPCFCPDVYRILPLIFIALEHVSDAGNLLFRKDESFYLKGTDCG